MLGFAVILKQSALLRHQTPRRNAVDPNTVVRKAHRDYRGGNVAAPRLPSQAGTICPADSLNGGVLAFVVPGGKLPQDDPGTSLKAAPFRYCSRLSRGFSLHQARQVLQHFIYDREMCWFISVPSGTSTVSQILYIQTQRYTINYSVRLVAYAAHLALLLRGSPQGERRFMEGKLSSTHTTVRK
ncbi:uncharacterized protein LOC142570548 [Dermacentor variabilis]|uniref:uncharacterized protein LOC142570548 n=1 Tax=Dermacentor variabilis TaxID=34621 RepID=UPI003F5AE047